MASTAFAGGTFEASTNCVGYDNAPMSGEAAEKTVFQWPTLTSRTALEGEPEGQTNGQVCRWNLISASTEEGRNDVDDGDCGIVHTNRPIIRSIRVIRSIRGRSLQRTTPSGWRHQIGVNLRFVPAPVCVATAKTQPPTAPPRWSVDAGPLWVDTMSDEALFLCAGHTNSSVLEAFDPADNNGFDRVNSALPTTHVDRMWAFFQGELGRRGVTDSYISGRPDVGGPLLLHQAYGTLPEGALQRAPAQGTPEVLRWGSRYYLYVLRDIAIPIARCLFAAQVSEFCGTVSEFKRTLYHPQSTRCPHLQISFMGTFIELKGGTE